MKSSLKFVLCALTLWRICGGSTVKCDEDEDCGDKQYCAPVNLGSRCVDCLDCSILLRENNLLCTHSLQDCGSCVSGYEEIPLTYSPFLRNKKPCTATKKEKDVGRNTSCNRDSECGAKQYCYEDRICADCLDCSIYFRHPLLAVQCAKGVEDCGSCLSGYLNVDVTDGSRPKPCGGTPAPYLSQSNEINVNVGALSLLGGVIVFAIILVLGIITYSFSHHSFPRNNTAEQTIESPPPYSHDVSIEDSQESLQSCGQVNGFFKQPAELDCMARVFQLPDYLRRGATTSREVSEAVLDEETMPCAWRPSLESNDNVSVLSFEGRLPCSTAPDLVDNARSLTRHNSSDEPSAKRKK